MKVLQEMINYLKSLNKFFMVRIACFARAENKRC